MKYKYYLVICSNTHNGMQLSTYQYISDHEIRDLKDINEIAESLSIDYSLCKPIILNYVLLESYCEKE